MSIRAIFKQKQGEKVEFVLRRHAITFVPSILLFLVMLALPVAGYLIDAADGQTILTGTSLAQVGVVLLVSAYYLGALLFFISQFTDFYLDISIITNDRILDIDQRGLFARVISELDLSRIQDVHSEIKGIFPTLFNYGRVEVQTAGDLPEFDFDDVPNPHAVRQRIIELAALDRKREARELKEAGGDPEDAHPLRQQGL